MALIEITTVTTTIYDTETQLSKVIKCETQEKDFDNSNYVPKVVTKSRKKTKVDSEVKDDIDISLDPLIKLVDNKLLFNNAAISLLGLIPGDSKIKIKYLKDVKGVIMPYIANIEIWGLKNGLKLAKNKSVIFRGVQNEDLSKYGELYKLKESKDKGIYLMVGNVEKNIPVDIIIPAVEDLKNKEEFYSGKDDTNKDIPLDDENIIDDIADDIIESDKIELSDLDVVDSKSSEFNLKFEQTAPNSILVDDLFDEENPFEL